MTAPKPSRESQTRNAFQLLETRNKERFFEKGELKVNIAFRVTDKAAQLINEYLAGRYSKTIRTKGDFIRQAVYDFIDKLYATGEFEDSPHLGLLYSDMRMQEELTAREAQAHRILEASRLIAGAKNQEQLNTAKFIIATMVKAAPYQEWKNELEVFIK